MPSSSSSSNSCNNDNVGITAIIIAAARRLPDAAATAAATEGHLLTIYFPNYEQPLLLLLDKHHNNNNIEVASVNKSRSLCLLLCVLCQLALWWWEEGGQHRLRSNVVQVVRGKVGGGSHFALVRVYGCCCCWYLHPLCNRRKRYWNALLLRTSKSTLTFGIYNCWSINWLFRCPKRTAWSINTYNTSSGLVLSNLIVAVAQCFLSKLATTAALY